MKKLLKSDISRKILWVLAGIVALALSVATIKMMSSSVSAEDIIGSRVYVAGSEQLALLREDPRLNAQITAIIAFGTSVRITEINTEGISTWIYIESNEGSGWIEATNLSKDVPER